MITALDHRNKFHVIKCVVELFEVGLENAKITVECLNSAIFEELKCKWSVKHIGINHSFGFAILEVEGKEGHQIYGWVNRLYQEVHTHIKITKEKDETKAVPIFKSL